LRAGATRLSPLNYVHLSACVFSQSAPPSRVRPNRSSRAGTGGQPGRAEPPQGRRKLVIFRPNRHPQKSRHRAEPGRWWPWPAPFRSSPPPSMSLALYLLPEPRPMRCSSSILLQLAAVALEVEDPDSQTILNQAASYCKAPP
jgi:hypothetical protein